MTLSSHIAVILDRTGSMADIRDDVIGGFNSFLLAQQAQPSPATFTLVQFDSQDPYEVVQPVVPIGLARSLSHETYVPRASTPLYDALGRGILDQEAFLARLPASERPPRVVIVVVTDGQENASHEFTRDRVMALITAKRQLGWDFVFLSADETAFADVGDMGVPMASRMMFKKNRQGSERAWASVSEKMVSMRSGASAGVVFDEQDRKGQDEAR